MNINNIEENILENFIKLYDKEIILHETIADDDIYIYGYDWSTHFIYNLKDILNEEGIFKQRFQYDQTIKKTIFYDSKIKFSKYHCDTIMFPFLNWNKHPLENRVNQYYDNYLSFFRRNDYLRCNFICKLEKVASNNNNNNNNNEIYKMVYYGNKKLLDRILTNRREYKINTFLDLISRNTIEKKLSESNNELHNILNNYPINVDNIQFKENDFIFLNDEIKLYDYQKEDIKWMNKIKQNIDNEGNIIDISYNNFLNINLDNNNYLLYNSSLLPNIDPNGILNYNEKIKYYGGNISSDIGLGKTIITLSYILQNSHNNYNQYAEFENTKCNYFFKRGKNKGSSCNNNKIERSLYCKEHNDTLFIDKRNIKLINMDNFNIRENIINNNKGTYFKSNASLIICPNHLCDQWVREYYDKFKQDNINGKRVLLIITYDQYKNLTFADILFADIIVVSYNFLLNNNYLKSVNFTMLNNYKNVSDYLDEIDQMYDITSIEQVIGKFSNKLNLLDNFYYKDIFLEESHEILDKPKSDILNKIINSLESKYKWNISATPFANGLKSLVHSLNFITGTKFVNSDIITKLNKDTIKSLQILYRRNTKDSVKKEYKGNIINNSLKLLEFTDQERRIYDAHSLNVLNKDFLIKLCCDTSIDVETRNLVKNCKTLEEIESVILSHNKKKLNLCKKKIEIINENIIELTNTINRGYIDDQFKFNEQILMTIDDVKIELSNCKRQLTNTKKEYDNINRTYTFLKNAIDNIKNKETCPICLDDIPDDQIAFTKCGHKFCKDCIHEYVEELNLRTDEVKCPKCNIPITIDSIYLLDDTVKIEPEDNDTDLNNLIQRVKSTKIGNIIHYIKNDLIGDNNKCIIFSQWDTLLTKVGRILENEGIKILFCTGTVYQRKRAIKSFQNDSSYNIICLSSENCASGINLTAANKIILIEPVYGSKEYRKDIENQAIGRSNRLGQKQSIEILRFIIKNSIEEDIYNENNNGIEIENENENENENVLEL